MIARIWDARTSGPHDTRRYQQVFDNEVLGHLSRVPGFRGAYLLARQVGHNDEAMAIRTITLFESLAAVRGFAGQDYEHERVTPQARATLLDSDPVITHFQVLSRPDI